MNLFTFSSNISRRKEFLLKLLLFALIFFLIFQAISYYYQKRIAKQNNFNLQIKKFSDLKNKIILLFLGDSHTARAIKHQFLPDNYYNLGYSGENYHEMFIKLKWAVDQQPAIKYVVLPSEYYAFTKFRANNNHILRSLRLASPKTVRKIYSLSKFKIYEYQLKFQYPLIAPQKREIFARVFMKDILGLLTGKIFNKTKKINEFNNIVYTKSKNWSELPPGKRKKKAKKRVRLHFAKPLITPELIKSYRAMLSFCHKNDIKIIFIKYPLAVEYQSAMYKHSLQQVKEIFNKNSVSARLNYIHIFDKQQRLFWDQDHLNVEGSKKFSKIIAKRLDSILQQSD